MRILRACILLIACSLLTAAGAAAQERRVGPPPKPFATVEMPSASTEVPMIPGDGVTLEVRIDGKGPYRFNLDTGAAGGGRITPELAETLGLPVVGQVMAGDPSGRNRRELKIVEAGTLSLGGATFSKVRLAVRELLRRPGDENRVDGVLGFGLFQDLLLTLDYPGRRVRIEPGELPAADGREVVGFEMRGGVPKISLKIGELEVDADVDSGNMQGELVLPASYLGKVPLETEPKVVGRARTGFNEFDIRQAPLKGAVRLGSHAVDHPLVDFVEVFPHANVGHAFLRRFTVTLDQKNGRIRFQAAASPG
jgi:Aspartyl protease